MQRQTWALTLATLLSAGCGSGAGQTEVEVLSIDNENQLFGAYAHLATALDGAFTYASTEPVVSATTLTSLSASFKEMKFGPLQKNYSALSASDLERAPEVKTEECLNTQGSKTSTYNEQSKRLIIEYHNCLEMETINKIDTYILRNGTHGFMVNQRGLYYEYYGDNNLSLNENKDYVAKYYADAAMTDYQRTYIASGNISSQAKNTQNTFVYNLTYRYAYSDGYYRQLQLDKLTLTTSTLDQTFIMQANGSLSTALMIQGENGADDTTVSSIEVTYYQLKLVDQIPNDTLVNRTVDGVFTITNYPTGCDDGGFLVSTLSPLDFLIDGKTATLVGGKVKFNDMASLEIRGDGTVGLDLSGVVSDIDSSQFNHEVLACQ